jgi:hypothetical protein
MSPQLTMNLIHATLVLLLAAKIHGTDAGVRAAAKNVVIAIVSGLLSKGVSWQQSGEYKEHVLAPAAFPLLNWLK